jgi:hypothetical protein
VDACARVVGPPRTARVQAGRWNSETEVAEIVLPRPAARVARRVIEAPVSYVIELGQVLPSQQASTEARPTRSPEEEATISGWMNCPRCGNPDTVFDDDEWEDSCRSCCPYTSEDECLTAREGLSSQPVCAHHDH